MTWLTFAAVIVAAGLLLVIVVFLLLAGIADENEGLPWPLDGEDDL